jgi:hypothetical protein
MKSTLSLFACASTLCALASACGAEASVWNAEAVEPIKPNTTPSSQRLETVRLVAPRNGVSSGQVIVLADTPVFGRCGNLSLKDGAARIPAAAVQVRYATTQRDLTGLGDFEAGTSTNYDALAEAPVPGLGPQPIWMTVKVPANADTGLYTGRLELSGGITAQVPVELEVSSFHLAEPKDYQAWICLNQSINSVSDRYGVSLYSDQHFKLLESNFRLLGALGHHLLSIPVIEQNFVGIKRGLVTFRRQGDQLVPDFSALERYARSQIQHCGIPRVVSLEIWQVYMAHRDDEKVPGRQRDKAVVSVADGKGGFETAEVSLYPNEAEFWKRIYAGTVERLGRLGISPERIMLGFYCDRRPNKAQVEFWKQVAPQAKWAGYTHGYAGYVPEGAQAGFCINPDFSAAFNNRTNPVRGGWSSPGPFFTSCRDFATDRSDPAAYRRLVDLSVGRANNGPSLGLSQVGFDFWLVKLPEATRPIRHMDPNDKLFSKHFRLVRGNPRSVTIPGPKGALATIRYEMLREGAQDAEARIVLEEALTSGRLTGPLKAEVGEALLDWHGIWKRVEGDKTPLAAFAGQKWQERARLLYQLAGKVQALASPQKE